MTAPRKVKKPGLVKCYCWKCHVHCGYAATRLCYTHCPPEPTQVAR